MRFKSLFIGALLALGFSQEIYAAYLLQRQDGRPNQLVQGRYYLFAMTQTNPIFRDPVRIRFGGVSPGEYDYNSPNVQVEPDVYRLDANDSFLFFVRFYVAPRNNITITVENRRDNTIFTTANIITQRYPVTFQMTPNTFTADAGVPFQISIRAIDAGGNFVSYFEDSVQIRDLQRGDVTTIPGSSFVAGGGVATANVTVLAGDKSNSTQLESQLVNIQYYDPQLPPPSLVPPALLYTPITIRPAAYDHIVMLFPGEDFVPGFSGKIGTPLTQTANTPVSEVQVWRVDQYQNPLLGPPGGAFNVRFTSTDPRDREGIDIPNPISMGGSPFRIRAADVNRFQIRTQGDRTITATPPSGGASSSFIRVDPGPGGYYRFTQQPVGPYTTDDIITVQITAYNALDEIDTTLNGVVPNSILEARVGTDPYDSRYVDTDPNDDFPQNVVWFISGVATVNLNVTKWSANVRLRFSDQVNPPVESNLFSVFVGNPARVHFTILGIEGEPLNGELHTPGIYPGNSGTPPIISAGDITTGQKYIVEARMTDRRWNIYGDNTGKQFVFNHILPNNYIATNVGIGVPIVFDNTGEFKYNPNPQFDRSFRVAIRTASRDPADLKYIYGVADFGILDNYSAGCRVNPLGYSTVRIEAPGENVRPGTTIFLPSGKEGVPNTQRAAVPFNVTVWVTDQFFNPIQQGDFPRLRFQIDPPLPGSSIQNVTLGQPVTINGSTPTFRVTLQAASRITVSDYDLASSSQSVDIPVSFGNLHHFRMTFANPQPKEAGIPFNVTIRAEDLYNNLVSNFTNDINLSANTGVDTMLPTTIRLTNGVFIGDLTVFAATETAVITMRRQTIVSESPSFVVNPNPDGYQRLLFLGPEEVHRPGTPYGKTGSNSPREVGLPTITKILATDRYFNWLGISGPTIRVTSDFHATFNPSEFTLVNGGLNQNVSIHLKTAGLHTIMAEDITTGGIASSTSGFTGTAGAYAKVQILAPGEVPDPGNDNNQGKNPGFPPLRQKVSVPFTMTVRAVDAYYNLVAPYNSGDIRISLLGSTSTVLLIPANNPPGGPTPRPYVNSVHQRQVILGEPGVRRLHAGDAQNQFDPDPAQVVDIFVDPGPVYEFTSPSTATTGVDFDVEIRLMENGQPVQGPPYRIFLTAVHADDTGTPASGGFTPGGGPLEVQVVNGVANVRLRYAHVEPIKIKLVDEVARLAFSPAINMVPGALRYQVLVPTQAVAGPPDTFSVRIELREGNTDTLVRLPYYNHTASVTAIAVLNPNQPVRGTLSVRSAAVSNGVSTFQVSYSKAESIALRVSEIGNQFGVVTSNSNSVLIVPGPYERLVILAPGERQAEGIYQHPTGKEGTPDTLRRVLPNLFLVRGTDRHWNTSTYNGGQIFFSSNEVSVGTANPVNQGAPLVNGGMGANVSFSQAGSFRLVADDRVNNKRAEVSFQVAGIFFEITVPNQPVRTNSRFPVTIRLRDPSGATVPVTERITLRALKPDGTPAEGQLAVTSAILENGTVRIDQQYPVAENILIEVTDGENTTRSNEIRVEPRAILYVFEELPERMDVNIPTNIRIRAMDADTGARVFNFNRSTTRLDFFDAVTQQPLPAGVCTPESAPVVQGVSIIPLTCRRLGGVQLRLEDPTDQIFGPFPVPTQRYYVANRVIQVRPGAIVRIDMPDLTVKANESVTATLKVWDTFNNFVPDQSIRFEVRSIQLPGRLNINGQPNVLIVKTDANGEANLTFEPSIQAFGDIEILMSDIDRPNGYSRTMKIKVLGLRSLLGRALEFGEDRRPVGSFVFFDLTEKKRFVEQNGGWLRTFYNIDGGEFVEYDERVGAGPLTQSKPYTLSHYSQACYSPRPQCNNPIDERSINGGPIVLQVTTYVVEDALNGYPSPFNPKGSSDENHVTIQFPLATASTVETNIYDLFGQKVWRNEAEVTPTVFGGLSHGRIFWFGVNDEGAVVANGGYVVVVRVGATGEEFKTKILVAK